jgi:hypothetical protein
MNKNCRIGVFFQNSLQKENEAFYINFGGNEEENSIDRKKKSRKYFVTFGRVDNSTGSLHPGPCNFYNNSLPDI